MTADKMDEGQGSTEKVEETCELQEACLAFTRRWASCWRHSTGSRLGRAPLVTAHRRRRRPASRRSLVGPSSVGGPEGFGFVKVDGADAFAHVSVVRGSLEGVVGCKVVVFLEVDVPPMR